MKKFWAEFKEFAIKGNMIDLAVGMIIGGAFTALVNGFMTNIVNPLIGLLTGGVDLDNLWKIPVGPVLEDGTQATGNLGAFISVIVNTARAARSASGEAISSAEKPSRIASSISGVW